MRGLHQITRSFGKLHGCFSFALIGLFSVICLALGMADSANAAYTNAQLDDRLRFGMETAVGLDYSVSGLSFSAQSEYSAQKFFFTDRGKVGPCYYVMQNHPLPGAPAGHAQYQVRSGDNLYAQPDTVSTGISKEGMAASYRRDVWLSLAGKPNITKDSTVTSGVSSVDLQLNSLAFSCRPYSNPVPANSCDLTGLQWMNTSNGWIRSTSLSQPPVDTGIHTSPSWNPPRNPGTNNCYTNEQIWGRVLPLNYTVVSGGGTVSGSTSENITRRDDSSRFWFSNPATLRYTHTGPITSDLTITIKMEFKRQNQYVIERRINPTTTVDYLQAVCFDDTRQKVIEDIQITGPVNYGNNTPKIPWSSCFIDDAEFEFTIKVDRPAWDTEGSTTLLGSSTLAAGGTANWNHTVRNLSSSAGATDVPIDYTVIQTMTGSPDSNVGSGTIPAGLGVGLTAPTINSNYTASIADIGKTICHYLRWNPVNSSNDGPRTTTPRCVTVVAKPFAQIWGHDIRVGSALSGLGGSSAQNSEIYGSRVGNFGTWGEYGIFAPSGVNIFATGHGLNGPTGAARAETEWNELTFANNSSCLTLLSGCYALHNNADLGYVPYNDVYDYFTTSGYTVSNSANTSSLTSPVPANTDLVYSRSGNFTIDKDIVYEDNLPADQIPQVVIIADNITINDNVRQVDAWLIARNTINTCNRDWNDLHTTVCNEQLVVNGPIMASTLNLKRTTQPTTTEEDRPAERLNLRSDTFLWLYQESRKTQQISTTYVRELPPRF